MSSRAATCGSIRSSAPSSCGITRSTAGGGSRERPPALDARGAIDIPGSAPRIETDNPERPAVRWIPPNRRSSMRPPEILLPTFGTPPADGFDALSDAIDALLPQTQCRQCGYAGCRPYAAAIASGEADINQCPPGGAAGIAVLAALLQRAPKPLNAAYGVEQPRALAVIDEPRCIGCTLCLQACPVDAIIGAPKLMHSVIADECTGCRLCVPPCPVDCIVMQPAPDSTPTTSLAESPPGQADRWRRRHEARLARLNREQRERDERAERQRAALQRPGAEEIARALERTQARKRASATADTPGTSSPQPPRSKDGAEA